MGLIAGLALPLGFATIATAQNAPSPAGGPPAAHDQRWGDPAQRQAMMAQHEAMRAQRLNDILQLTPAQQPALQTFLAAMKPAEHDHTGARDGDHGDRGGAGGQQAEHLTAPQRMDRMLARFDKMRTQLQARADATKAFYAQLSPTQQKAFDDLGPMGGDRHGGFGGGMHGGPGGGWGHHPMGPDGQPANG
jgi:hypothetical protein